MNRDAADIAIALLMAPPVVFVLAVVCALLKQRRRP